MAEPFLAEIRMFSYELVPRGWFKCEGQILPIRQYQALFSLLGTTYGGDGTTTFALPDLRGRTPVHASASMPNGHTGGEGEHSLAVNEMPSHTHTAFGSVEPPQETSPQSNAWSSVKDFYGPPESAVLMNNGAVSSVGSGLPHSNLQPYLTVSFCIAYQGIFPSRN